MSGEFIEQLFQLVDRNKDGKLDFSEVAALFRQLQPQQSERSAHNAAVEALLLSDRSADSQLNRQEFEHMLSKVAEMGGVPLEEATQRLLEVTQQQQQQQQTQREQPQQQEQAQQQLHKHLAQQQQQSQQQQQRQQHPDTVPASEPPGQAVAPPPAQQQSAAAGLAVGATPPPPAPAAPAASSQQQQPTDSAPGPPSAAAAATETAAAVAGQLQQLFELWDKGSDGRIDLTELCQGLSKLQQPPKHKQDITALVSQAGQVLGAHDADGDRQLNLAEFSAFIMTGAAAGAATAAGGQMQDVLAQLISLAQSKPDSAKLQRALVAAQPQLERVLGTQPTGSTQQQHVPV